MYIFHTYQTVATVFTVRINVNNFSFVESTLTQPEKLHLPCGGKFSLMFLTLIQMLLLLYCIKKNGIIKSNLQIVFTATATAALTLAFSV